MHKSIILESNTSFNPKTVIVNSDKPVTYYLITQALSDLLSPVSSIVNIYVSGCINMQLEHKPYSGVKENLETIAETIMDKLTESDVFRAMSFTPTTNEPEEVTIKEIFNKSKLRSKKLWDLVPRELANIRLVDRKDFKFNSILMSHNGIQLSSKLSLDFYVHFIPYSDFVYLFKNSVTYKFKLPPDKAFIVDNLVICELDGYLQICDNDFTILETIPDAVVKTASSVQELIEVVKRSL